MTEGRAGAVSPVGAAPVAPVRGQPIRHRQAFWLLGHWPLPLPQLGSTLRHGWPCWSLLTHEDALLPPPWLSGARASQQPPAHLGVRLPERVGIFQRFPTGHFDALVAD